MKVAVVGASPKPERYSNMAIRALRDAGHELFPVNPGHDSIEGLPCFRTLGDLPEPVDTATLYVSPAHSTGMGPSLIKSKARRVIFNPGTENSELQESLRARGIEVLEACTLVMLRTDLF